MRAIAIAAAISLIGGAAAAQSILQVGQTINGQLTTTDSRLDDGSYYDCYNLKPQAGQRIQIDQTSTAFDSFLVVMLGSCGNPVERLAADDDSGGGLNSRIVLTADGRELAVVANSIHGGATGAYQLRVSVIGSGAAASAAPRSNANANAQSGSTIRRPSGGQERYDWDVLCKAADTVALVDVIEGMNDDQMMAWLEDSGELHDAVQESGRAIGKTDEDILNDIGRTGAAIMNDVEISNQVAALRQGCLGLL